MILFIPQTFVMRDKLNKRKIKKKLKQEEFSI